MAPNTCSPDETVLWLRGEYDADNAPALRDDLRHLVEQGETDIVVDLQEVAFMDASTVGVLVAAITDMTAQSRCLCLRAPSRPARRVLSICGLDETIRSTTAARRPARHAQRTAVADERAAAAGD